MPITQDLFGTNYSIPQSRDKKWGASLTSFLVNVAKAITSGLYLVGTNALHVFASANSTLAADATLTRTAATHRLAGSGGAVTLSTSTAIADGTKDGEALRLLGTSNTNTVTIRNGANTLMNGAWVGGLGDILDLQWDTTIGDWVEVGRNS